MFKTLALAAASCLALNKLAYYTLLKSPPRLKTKILGQGQFITLSYNPITHKWINGLRSDSFSTPPSTNLSHVQDFLLINAQYPACFRLRPCYSSLSRQLSKYNLSVTQIQSVDFSDLSQILLDLSIEARSLIRVNLWEEVK
jgi:hypothetical protein